MGVGEASGQAAYRQRNSHSFLLSHLYMASVAGRLRKQVYELGLDEDQWEHHRGRSELHQLPPVQRERWHARVALPARRGKECV